MLKHPPRHVLHEETVKVEGVIVPYGGPDKDGDEFVPGSVDTEWFVVFGYMVSRCDIVLRTDEIIGRPDRVVEREDGVHLEATVYDGPVLKAVKAKANLGFAISGVIGEREGSECQGHGRILRCEVKAVAIIPADRLIDPRCRCSIIEGG